MILPVFIQNLDCAACGLHEHCKHVGVPTRLHAGNRSALKAKAVLVVGERPGVEEDDHNATLIGKTGRLFDAVYCRGAKLAEHADVFVANAVRCKPPKDVSITATQFKACKQYLEDDLAKLSAIYQEVVIVGAGAGAARSLRGSTLEKAFYAQGVAIEIGGRSYTTFWTYNPANLLEDRNPSAVDSVCDHLGLVTDYLRTGEVPIDVTVPDWMAAPRHFPSPRPNPLSVDIETYGAIEGLNQTVFQPRRSLVTDRIPTRNLVQTTAASWRDGDGRLVTALWDVQDPDQYGAFRDFIQDWRKAGGTWLLGMNTQFDVSYLRQFYGKAFLDYPDVGLLDLGITNYLHSEVRPERSLKNLSLIMRVADYTEEKLISKGHRYKNSQDPELHFYNVKDTVATLVAYERLNIWIARDYPGSAKGEPYSRDWYNRLIWFAVEAAEDGVYWDRRAVEELEVAEIAICERMKLEVQERGGILEGTGSAKWFQKTINEAVAQAKLGTDRRVKKTPAKKAISANDENFNLVLGCLPPDCEVARDVHAIQEFKTHRDNVVRYTRPLLHGRRKSKTAPLNEASTILEDGLVHPTWYVIPGQFETGESGGTKQGRITCRNPGLLNLSKPVKSCLSTRFDPGVLIEADLSQIELRTGALLSGDPLMLQWYAEGIDYHAETGKLILSEILAYMKSHNLDAMGGVTREWIERGFAEGTHRKGTPEFATWRMLGKTLNFLVLFKGGPKKAQETAIRDNGVLLPLEVWERIVKAFDQRHPTFRSWQSEWIRNTVRRGYAELPLIGQSRLFRGGRLAAENFINEIANFPIQTQAANTLIDGAWKARQIFRNRGMLARSSLYIYDAMYVEAPTGESEAVQAIVKECLTNVDYWHRLERIHGRTCPVDAEVKVIRERTIAGRKAA